MDRPRAGAAPETTTATGVFCLANDGVLPWFHPFVASLRMHEPDLPLLVIPYDDRLDAVRRLSHRFGFEIWDHPAMQRLDEVGSHFTPTAPARRHLFRKLAAFWGPLDRFLFLDTDIVVLASLKPMLAATERSPAQLVYADADLDTVYRRGVFRDEMVRHGAVGWQSGVFISSRGLLTMDHVDAALRRALPVRHELTRWNGEQSFLNFITDLGEWHTQRLSDLDPALPCTVWARQPVVREGSSVHPVVRGTVRHDVTLPLLHWAGDRPGPLMPHAVLYLRQRLATLGPIGRFRFLVTTWPWAGIRSVLVHLRRRGRLRRTSVPPA